MLFSMQTFMPRIIKLTRWIYWTEHLLSYGCSWNLAQEMCNTGAPLQEIYVRHANGSPMNTEAERLRVIQCLEAAIERRVSEVTQFDALIWSHIVKTVVHVTYESPFSPYRLPQGVKLELCTNDKVGLLSEVTRIFRENSLTVTRAEVSTRERMAINTFYVRDSAGETVDQKTIDSIRQAIGQNIQVKGQPEPSEPQKKESPTWFLFANLFRPRSLYTLSTSFGLFMRWSHRPILKTSL